MLAQLISEIEIAIAVIVETPSGSCLGRVPISTCTMGKRNAIGTRTCRLVPDKLAGMSAFRTHRKCEKPTLKQESPKATFQIRSSWVAIPEFFDFRASRFFNNFHVLNTP